MSIVDIARRLDLTPAAVSFAVQRGEKIVKEAGYQLEE
jgi:DNA-binding transcriptional LysR family regulator